MIERLIRWAFTHRKTVLLAAGLLLVGSLLLVSRVTFDADILRLLPQEAPVAKSFGAYLEHFGTVDHIYVLFEVPPGRQISDHEAFVDRYVDELRKAPEIAAVDAELFDDVKDWNYLFDRELLLLGSDQARVALARLEPGAIGEALRRSRSLLAMSSPEVKAYVQQDPLGLLAPLRDRLARGRSLVDFDPTQKGYVSRDGRSRLVLAEPVQPPFDTEFCKRLFARLAEIEAAVRAVPAEDVEDDAEEATADVTVRVAGGYRISLEAERLIRSELTSNGVLSLVGLLVFDVIIFRTPWILIFGTVPLMLATLLMLGVNGMAGPLSLATSGTTAMLFGPGIDGIVMIYLRYNEERGRGFSDEDAMARTAGTAWSVILAYVTTAATFLALTVLDFPSLEDVGRFVTVGILACTVLSVTLLPALIGATAPRTHERAGIAAWLGRLVERRGRAILVIAGLSTLALGAAVPRLRVDMSLDRLKATTDASALEEEVAARFSLPRDVLLALGEGPQLEPLLASAQALAAGVAHDSPSTVVSSPDVVLPGVSEQESVGEALRSARLDPTRVAGDLEREAAALGFRPDAFRHFAERLPRMLDPSQRLTYDGLVAHGLGALVSRHIARGPNGFLVVVYLYPREPADFDRLGALVARYAPSFRVTGVQPVNRELADRFLPQFLTGVTVGTLAVALSIYLAFRSVGHTVLAFVPSLVGFLWSAGLLALFGVELDLFSLFGTMTFVGISTDYALYVIHRYSIEGTRPMRDVIAKTGTGVLVSCGTTLIGFATLIGSSYRPLHSFGVTAVTTLACCLVASLLVLPALLQEAKGT